MSVSLKLAAFVTAAAVAFAAAYGIGQAVGPVDDDEPAATDAHGHDAPDEADAGTAHGGHDAPATPGGLQVAQEGYRLDVTSGPATAGREQHLRFRILGPDGQPVTDFATSHDKQMHLIVARRDLSGFQHLHPTMDTNGTWQVPIVFGGAGDHRVFADFVPAGRPDGLTLGTDVAVTGTYAPVPLPAAERIAVVGDYTVQLDGTLVPGQTSELTLTVSRNGEPVTDLQPYLAAYGHLVALRAGDLAYLHVHPDGEPGDGVTRPGPAITFFAEVPSEGEYRLFLDFRHDGVVRTAEFTAVAGATPSGAGHAPGGHSHGETR